MDRHLKDVSGDFIVRVNTAALRRLTSEEFSQPVAEAIDTLVGFLTGQISYGTLVSAIGDSESIDIVLHTGASAGAYLRLGFDRGNIENFSDIERLGPRLIEIEALLIRLSLDYKELDADEKARALKLFRGADVLKRLGLRHVGLDALASVMMLLEENVRLKELLRLGAHAQDKDEEPSIQERCITSLRVLYPYLTLNEREIIYEKLVSLRNWPPKLK